MGCRGSLHSAGWGGFVKSHSLKHSAFEIVEMVHLKVRLIVLMKCENYNVRRLHTTTCIFEVFGNTNLHSSRTTHNCKYIRVVSYKFMPASQEYKVMNTSKYYVYNALIEAWVTQFIRDMGLFQMGMPMYNLSVTGSREAKGVRARAYELDAYVDNNGECPDAVGAALPQCTLFQFDNSGGANTSSALVLTVYACANTSWPAH